MQLGLVLLLPDEIHNLVRELQLRVRRACGANPALRITPHVTLKQLFDTKNLEGLEAYLHELVGSLHPPEARLVGLGRFDEEGVIYVPAVPSPELSALRLRILADLADRFRVRPRDIEDNRYLFHASLSYDLDSEALERAWESVRSSEVDVPIRFPRLALAHYTGEEWFIYRRWPLASQ